MITKVKNGRIISNGKLVDAKNLYFSENGIIAVTDNNISYDKLVDANDNYVSAGFIDMHVHGGGGHDFMDGGTEAIIKAAEAHLLHGTTSIFPTSLACSHKTLLEFISDLKTVIDKKLCKANVIGAHLEGPFFSLKQSGAQNPDYITPPEPSKYKEEISAADGIIRRWSFAPELEGSAEFCKTLIQNNIIPAIGHSDATYKDIQPVYDLGCKLVTHLYSGMSTITRTNGYRSLGVVESAYLLEDMVVELIADGRHLPPELLKMVIKCKPQDTVCLITDAMRSAGTNDKESFLGRKCEAMPCIIEDNVAKLMDKSGFAGSVATTDVLLKTMVNDVKLNIVDAAKLLTVNPAKAMNLKSKGDIVEGFDADIVIFDENINIHNIFVAGNEIVI